MQKLTPISFTDEETKAFEEQLNVQERQQGTPRSIDPNKYPVFQIPVGRKILVYVPKHIIVDNDGVEHLRMDKPLIHSVQKGRQFLSYRCVNGLVKEGFLSGTCPLCEGCAEPWELANKIIAQKCKAQGLSPDDTENKDVKAIRSAQFSDRLLKDASRYYTFPLVVLETKDDDGKTPVRDESTGGYKYRVYWYSISEQLYEEKWVAALEATEDAPTHPGGLFFCMNFIYTPSNGKQQEARDAARKVSISVRRFKDTEKIRAYFDKETESWTPALARQTLYANMIYPETELQELVDEVLLPTRQMLALYNGSEASAQISTSKVAGGFQLEKPATSAANNAVPEGAVPVDTDVDDEELPLGE